MQDLVQISNYFNSLSPQKKEEMEFMHFHILNEFPGIYIRFLDGKNDAGKVVSNPNIGYGSTVINYSDGSSKEFYRFGISANTSGISVYIMGIEDKNYLLNNFGDRLGKATITSYCIKFKSLKNINFDVLLEVFRGLVG